MAWTSPRTWVALEVLTAALLNTHLRDNLLQTAPAKVTTAGDLVYATGSAALARLGIGTAGQQLVGGTSAPAWSDRGIQAEAREFIERGTYKSFALLGACPYGNSNIADNEAIGLGFKTYINTGTIQPETTSGTDEGSWRVTTQGSSGSEDVGFLGPRFSVARDWTFSARVKVGSLASQNWFMAFGSRNFADHSNVIGFRIAGTGNLIGVCDSGGTETTRDSGANGNSEMLLRIEVRSGGTIVRFYKNGSQIGADVTTNIPTGQLSAILGIRSGVAQTALFNAWDACIYQEVG